MVLHAEAPDQVDRSTGSFDVNGSITLTSAGTVRGTSAIALVSNMIAAASAPLSIMFLICWDLARVLFLRLS